MPQTPCPHCRLGIPLPPRHRAEECPACGRTYLVELKVPSPATPHPATTLSVDEKLPSRTLPPSNSTVMDDDETPPHGRPAPRRVAPARRTAPPRERRAEAATSQMAQSSLKPGTMLGGYQLVARLGAGGMGTVWLARQLSLDRNVAVKILRPTLAKNPAFVVQFAHEALAAAQLVHHNIAQIYDTGTEGKLHFFSMEYVEGESLSALLRREGKLDSEVATGYVLQAARGLKFAHERKMIHRDIKPENLLINRDGIVKVADLGLVKRTNDPAVAALKKAPRSPGLGDLDSVDVAEPLGTPQFMAPEQANDSATIDARADIYSLGCTLYNLIAGRPPFEGESSVVVMTKHFFEAPVPPEQHNRRIPAELSAIVLKMLAKKPEQRYQDMDEVIGVLEDFLGVDGSAVFSPREEHAALLERSVEDFNGASWSRRRRVAVAIFFTLVVGVTGLAGWLRSPRLAAGAVVTALALWGSTLLVNAFAQRAQLLLQLRQLVVGASPWLWLTGVLIAAVGGVALGWYGLVRNAVALIGGAVVSGLVFYLVFDRRLAQQRRAPLEAVEQMLKTMRLKGLEEMALRQFVCKYSGQDWEPFYEALFGYDGKLLARTRWGRDEKNLPRKRRGVWRDPLVRWVNGQLGARQRAKDQRHLKSLEQRPGAAA